MAPGSDAAVAIVVVGVAEQAVVHAVVVVVDVAVAAAWAIVRVVAVALLKVAAPLDGEGPGRIASHSTLVLVGQREVAVAEAPVVLRSLLSYALERFSFYACGFSMLSSISYLEVSG